MFSFKGFSDVVLDGFLQSVIYSIFPKLVYETKVLENRLVQNIFNEYVITEDF